MEVVLESQRTRSNRVETVLTCRGFWLKRLMNMFRNVYHSANEVDFVHNA